MRDLFSKIRAVMERIDGRFGVVSVTEARGGEAVLFDALDRLRLDAGQPSFREIAKAAGGVASPSTVHKHFQVPHGACEVESGTGLCRASAARRRGGFPAYVAGSANRSEGIRVNPRYVIHEGLRHASASSATLSLLMEDGDAVHLKTGRDSPGAS